MKSLEDKIQNKIIKLNYKIAEGNLAFRRNHSSYEYSSYINHAISFYYSANWDMLQLFVNRAENYLLSNSENVYSEYLELSKELLSLFRQLIKEYYDV